VFVVAGQGAGHYTQAKDWVLEGPARGSGGMDREVRSNCPSANKGEVVRVLSRMLDVPAAQIATIGDMPNDVLMFECSGVSIAMANASVEVQRAARFVTSSNTEEGFAVAMERFVLRARSVA